MIKIMINESYYIMETSPSRHDDNVKDDDDYHLAASSDTFLRTLMARNTRPTFRTFLLVICHL